MSNPTRREFLTAAAAAPIVSPILLGMQDKAGSGLPVMGEGAHRYEATHDWGQLPPNLKWGNTHAVVQDASGLIYIHHTVHATSEVARLHRRLRSERQVRPIVGPAVPRRRARHGHPPRRVAGVLVSDREFGRARHRERARDAGVDRQSDADGRDRLARSGTARHRRLSARRPTSSGRRATTRRTWRSRRTATCTSRTATASISSTSTTRRASTCGRSAVAAPSPARCSSRTGSGSTPAAPTPVLVVADRRNNRLQRFTLDGKHIDFVTGLPVAVSLPRAQRHRRHSRFARPGDAHRSEQLRDRSPR